MITLTIGQLQDLIVQAVEKAIHPLQEELSELRDNVASQREELDAMRAKLADLESREEQDVDRICLEGHPEINVSGLLQAAIDGKIEAAKAQKE